MQKQILSAQTRSIELQQTLIIALTGGSLGDSAQVAGQQVADQSEHLKEAQEFDKGKKNSGPQFVVTSDHVGEQRQADEGKKDSTKEEMEEFLDTYDVAQDWIPWHLAPRVASFFGIMSISMFHHPGDMAVCFPDRSAFFSAAEAAMSPGRYRDFLVTSLELRLLFQSLLLSITVPASLSQKTPTTHLELVLSVFTFLLGFLNTLGTALCIFATGILSSVSEANINAWLKANHRLVHAALSSQCLLVPLILFLQTATQIKIQLSVDWLDTQSQNVICAIQITIVMCFMSAMLFLTNAAGRSAAFSGSMGDAAIPSSKDVFCATMGGNKVGLSGMLNYLKAVREGSEKPKAKKKTLLHKTNHNGQVQKSLLHKFDVAVL